MVEFLYSVKKESNRYIVTIFNPKKQEESVDFIMTQSGVINKTKIVMKHIKKIIENNDKAQFYYDLIKKFKDTQDKDLLYENIDTLVEISQKFTEEEGPDFKKFVDKKKKTKTSVLLSTDEVEKLFTLTIILKVYMPFSSTNLIQIDEQIINRTFFKYIRKKLKANKLLIKLQDLVTRKIFRASGMDHMMLDMIQRKSVQTEEDFSLTIFDFILSSILVIYDMEHNPVTFIVTSVDSMAKWYFTDLYKKAIVYKEVGELFGVSTGTADLADKILDNKIMRSVEKYVSKTLRNKGINITSVYEKIEVVRINELFYDQFILPIFAFIFDCKLKSLYKLARHDKVLIQLLFYFVYDKLRNQNSETCEEILSSNMQPPMCEIFRRIAVLDEEKNRNKPIKKRNVYTEFFVSNDDDCCSTCNQTIKDMSSTYQLTQTAMILKSKFKYYGTNNITTILLKYLQHIMGLISNMKTFTCAFSEPGLQKNYTPNKNHMNQIEKEIIPFSMVILDPDNETFLPEISKFKLEVQKTIRSIEVVKKKVLN